MSHEHRRRGYISQDWLDGGMFFFQNFVQSAKGYLKTFCKATNVRMFSNSDSEALRPFV